MTVSARLRGGSSSAKQLAGGFCTCIAELAEPGAWLPVACPGCNIDLTYYTDRRHRGSGLGICLMEDVLRANLKLPRVKIGLPSRSVEGTAGLVTPEYACSRVMEHSLHPAPM